MDSPWLFQDQEFIAPDPNPYEGYVYLIECLANGKKYVGKKNFWTRRKVKGRRQKKESDWKKYWGSNDELKMDVEEFGPAQFKRTILYLCLYKKQMSFLEENEQWHREVIMRDDYYNTNIAGRYFVFERRIYQAKKENECSLL